jgi:methionine-R-sulfoxide reductase
MQDDYTPKFIRPTDKEIHEKLDENQYKVTQEEATEPAFENEYWDNEEDGVYVDIVTGQPLFDSRDKYDAGCGWPSFTKPISEEVIEKKTDWKLLTPRTKVHSKIGESHLGHVFDDGPVDQGGKRFCINSAALKFIPRAEAIKMGIIK